jgi:hypothetical protein
MWRYCGVKVAKERKPPASLSDESDVTGIAVSLGSATEARA